MATPLTSPVVLGDVVTHIESPQVCYESITLTNNTGAELNVYPGYPLNESGGVWDPTLATEEGSIDGLLAEKVEGLAAAGTRVVQILKRGPAVVNVDSLPATDVADDAFNEASIVTRLAALDIIAREEPDVQETQDT